MIPYSLLVADESLDPEALTGRGFEAEVGQDEQGRWVVSEIAFASRCSGPTSEASRLNRSAKRGT